MRLSTGRLRAASLAVVSVYATALAGYAVLIMYTNLPLYRDYRNDGAEAPYFDILLILLSVPLGLLTWRRWPAFLKHPYTLWIALLAACYAVSLARLHQGEGGARSADLAEATDRLQRVILPLVYAYLAFVIGRSRFERFLPVALLVISALVVLDFFRPDLVNPSNRIDNLTGRGSGTYLNPNVAAEALVLTLALVYRRYRGNFLVLLYLLCGVGVLATFSRGGLIAWLLLTVFVFSTRRMPRWSFALPILMIAFYSTLLIYAERLLPLVIENETRVENMLDRLSFFERVGEGGVDDYSADERRFVATKTLSDALRRPFLGHAMSTDSAYGVGVHNQALELWYAFGLLGLLAWIALVFMLNRNAPSRLFGLVAPESLLFVWFSMFSHTLFAHNFWFLFFALTISAKGSFEPVREWRRVTWERPSPSRARRPRSVRPGAWRGRFG